jgi:hypothetical protein
MCRSMQPMLPCWQLRAPLQLLAYTTAVNRDRLLLAVIATASLRSGKQSRSGKHILDCVVASLLAVTNFLGRLVLHCGGVSAGQGAHIDR